LQINQKKFAKLRICGLVVTDLKIQLRGHHCKFVTGVNDAGGKLPLVLTTWAVNLPPVSIVGGAP
jgi:hypothetical protein